MTERHIAVNGRDVRLSSPDKVLFPEVGYTKGDLADYYLAIGPRMVPLVRDRPVTMTRHPDGIERKGFFHKDTPDYFPDWIERIDLPKKGGVVHHPTANSTAALVYLAQQNTITVHTGLSRVGNLQRPDRYVVDLDPSTDDFAVVREMALAIADVLAECGLTPFVQTTGSKGLHIVCPLDASVDFGGVGHFSNALAGLLLTRHPDALTGEFLKADRGDRIYLDLGRNGFTATMAAPYSVRPRPNAPVTTPIDWSDVSRSDLRPDRYTIADIEWLITRVDPWAAIGSAAANLAEAARHLLELS